jgi:hypothetical protein
MDTFSLLSALEQFEMKTFLLSISWFFLGIVSAVAEHDNPHLQLKVAVYNEMLERIVSDHDRSCFLDEDEVVFGEIKDKLIKRNHISYDRVSNAEIVDGRVRSKDSDTPGIMLKVSIKSIDENDTAIVIGSWFSSPVSSASVMYWLNIDKESNGWKITKKKTLLTS